MIYKVDKNLVIITLLTWQNICQNNIQTTPDKGFFYVERCIYKEELLQGDEIICVVIVFELFVLWLVKIILAEVRTSGK